MHGQMPQPSRGIHDASRPTRVEISFLLMEMNNREDVAQRWRRGEVIATSAGTRGTMVEGYMLNDTAETEDTQASISYEDEERGGDDVLSCSRPRQA